MVSLVKVENEKQEQEQAPGATREQDKTRQIMLLNRVNCTSSANNLNRGGPICDAVRMLKHRLNSAMAARKCPDGLRRPEPVKVDYEHGKHDKHGKQDNASKVDQQEAGIKLSAQGGCSSGKQSSPQLTQLVLSAGQNNNNHRGSQLSSFIIFASAVILLNLCPPFQLDSDLQTSSSSSLSSPLSPLDISTLPTDLRAHCQLQLQHNDEPDLLTKTATTAAATPLAAIGNLETLAKFVKLMFSSPMRMNKRTARYTLAEARVLGKMAKVWYIKKKIKKLSKKLKKHTIAVPVFTAIPIYEHSYYPQPHVTHVTHGGAMHHHAAASSYAPSSIVAAGPLVAAAAAASSSQQLATAASNQQHQIAAYRIAPPAVGYAHASQQQQHHHHHNSYRPGGGGGGGAGGHHIINAYTPSQPLFVDDTGGLYGQYGNAYGRYDGGFHVWMADLFSQIPVQVLNRARRGGVTLIELDEDEDAPKKKVVKFFDDKEVRSKEIEDGSSTEVSSSPDIYVDDVSVTNEPSSSRIEPAISKECYDAVTQTIQPKSRDFGTQTDESLLTRPLCSTDNDIQRLNMQSFSPIMPIPRRKAGFEPPLRIGLTLRGKKRKIFYPDDDDNEENNI